AFKKSFEPLLTGEGVPFVNNPDFEKYEGQPYFVSEFGGALGWPADRKAPDSEIEDFYRRFEAQVSTLLDNPKMCAFCYTQLVDVYQENNGIYLFDRGEKFDIERLRKIVSRKAAIETED
ncbi:MAG: beta-galactosidase, partial [Clostridia bacterium]|nr:beta-galactosidase [Clostridia bacterium]